MKKSYPYTIDNGMGERLTFTGITHGPEGERAEAFGIAKPGAGPPMHVHYLQDEGVQVVRGRVGYQVLGQEPQFAGPGEVVVWPAGTAHKWWNAGDEELHMAGWCCPPDNVEFYLETLFTSTKAHGGRPAIFDVAFLLTRYRSEFAMLEMPALMQRLVIPIVYGLGMVLGKYRKFKDAPLPVSRAPRQRPPST